MVGLSLPEQSPIPGYEVVRRLGINLGVIYLARHMASGALVGLKVWRLEFAEHARELHAPTARLNHPNIVHVYGLGEFEGYYFCALELAEHSLADRLREGCLPDGDVARLARAIGSAIQYARAQGMKPESLSPQSVLLTDNNVPKLDYFCPIGSFRKQQILPPPNRMPPEWLSRAGDAGELSEVYRVGALMYEMLTARPPFTADSALGVVTRVLNEIPEPPRKVNPSVGRNIDAVCMKCLAKDPKARYASLQELLDYLGDLESN